MKCIKAGCEKTALENSNYCLDHQPKPPRTFRDATDFGSRDPAPPRDPRWPRGSK